ncbi:hypothetical protein K5I29_04815 [Flavobacterium agricola]|uniref:Uncharacterized protein n=1 Tax=Flavobacterium agricola TaxID=2870839 RepID=A0ABY6M4S7_9FLAO|nr:hypothetical protein [Flavobacterium agricola]UYW02228.1 hypothetical protein K5I29_04815 [Flavobacterium agricola]
MKKTIIFLLLSQIAFAQKLSKPELLEHIAKNICEELAKPGVDIHNDTAMGLFLLKNVGDYKDDVIYYFGTDGTIGIETMQRFGEEIGMRLAIECPDAFTALFTDEEANDTAYQTAFGRFDKIQNKQFLSFTIKENSGKTTEFYLLNDFESAYLLTDNQLKKNDVVELTYFESSLYDPKLKQFRIFNIVSFIEKK